MSRCTIPLAILLAALLSADSTPLHEAVKDGKVTVRITGMGASTGDAIQLTVQRKTKETVRLTMAPGTVFTSARGRVQNMAGAGVKGERVSGDAYRPSREIVLIDDKEHTFIIEAYCLDFRKDNPTKNDTFTVSAPDERVAALLAAGEKSSANTKVLQSAIWMERDKVTPEEVKRRFPVGDDEIQAATSLLQNTVWPKPSKRDAAHTSDIAPPRRLSQDESRKYPSGREFTWVVSFSNNEEIQPDGSQKYLLTDQQTAAARKLVRDADTKADAGRVRLVVDFVRLLGADTARKSGLLFYDGDGKAAYVWPGAADRKKEQGGRRLPGR